MIETKDNKKLRNNTPEQTMKKLKKSINSLNTRPLTIKQRKFVDEVVKSGNATQAVKKAGYKHKNTHVAESIGSENLRKPEIKAEIEDRLETAKKIIYWLATGAEKEETRLRAAQDIIDRGEWKATQIIKQTTVNLTPEEIEKMDINSLLGLIKK